MSEIDTCLTADPCAQCFNHTFPCDMYENCYSRKNHYWQYATIIFLYNCPHKPRERNGFRCTKINKICPSLEECMNNCVPEARLLYEREFPNSGDKNGGTKK